MFEKEDNAHLPTTTEEANSEEVVKLLSYTLIKHNIIMI